VKQTAFEARHGADWEHFERWLDSRGKRGQPPADAERFDEVLVPQRYRQLCQHLALARDREYSPDLVDRLNSLVLRGHHVLYGARARQEATRGLAFLLADFPRQVREERSLLTAASLLFFGPFLLLIAALQWYPDFIYYVLDPATVSSYQEMYNPGAKRLGQRESDTNVAMFGFYIWNNVKVGIQTFATGLAFGIGSVFYLLANGVIIGAVAGYLTQIGNGVPFWSFVSGHSAMELTAIVVSGAAGLRLGGAVIAPGRVSRKAALVAAARPAVRLMLGAALMFIAAAFIEAFWSPLNSFPAAFKYAVGIAMWVLVIVWLGFGGRARAA
jgi:uncharacterized membrane protein SpoIIM required for sporulation